MLFSLECAPFTFPPTVREGSFLWNTVFIQRSLNESMKKHHSSHLGRLKTSKNGFSVSLLPLGQGAFLREAVRLLTNLLLSKIPSRRCTFHSSVCLSPSAWRMACSWGLCFHLYYVALLLFRSKRQEKILEICVLR